MPFHKKLSSLNIDRNRNRRDTKRFTEHRTPSSSSSSFTVSSPPWMCKVALVPLLIWTVLYLKVFRSETFDPFDQAFCDADGNCHEKPDAASSRTVYSARNKKQFDLWWEYVETLGKQVENYASNRQHTYEKNQQLNHDFRTRPLILLGDSITESWSGTGLGVSKKRAKGVAHVLESELSTSSGLDPITRGEPFYDPSAIFVVMIGTNNLGSGELPEPTIKGVLAVAEHILRETSDAGCNVMLFGVLPRGDGKKVLPSLCPPRCSDDALRTPYASFLPAIETVNKGLSTGVTALAQSYPSKTKPASPRIQLVDCGSEFLNKDYNVQKKYGDNGNYEVREELMPDLLHPNAEGHVLLAKCIRDYIGQITK
eukprot:jgi/Psemu1/178132/e_gw1.3.41.1